MPLPSPEYFNQNTGGLPSPDMSLSKYPRLSNIPFKVSDQTNNPNSWTSLEFYPPDEPNNPFPGETTVGVFDKEMLNNPDKLMDALTGELLHSLPLNDPNFKAMRDNFATTLTPRQTSIDDQAYEIDRMLSEYPRSREQFMDTSRLDAYLRGYLNPDEQDNWRGYYSPQQERILDQLKMYLRRDKGLPEFKSPAGGG